MRVSSVLTPRVIVCLFLCLCTITMMFVTRCGMNFESPTMPHPVGMRVLESAGGMEEEVQKRVAEILQVKEGQFERDLAQVNQEMAKLRNQLADAQLFHRDSNSNSSKDVDKLREYENFIKGKLVESEIVGGIALNNEYEVFPFTRFTAARLYLVDPGLGKRVVEKPIGYKKKELMEVVEFAIKQMNEGRTESQAKFSPDEFLEGIFKTEPGVGTHYEVYFRNVDKQPSQHYCKVIVWRPYAPLHHIQTKEVSTTSEIINLILPLSGRVEKFRFFMDRFARVCTKMSSSQDRRAQYGAISYLNDRSYGARGSLERKYSEERLAYARNLYRKDLKSHYGCVNAIEFSHNAGELFVSGGDDRRVLLWQTERALDEYDKPQSMQLDHNSNIFCLAFDRYNRRIFSGGNDELVIVHDIESGGRSIDVYKHEEAIYGLAHDPINENVFASACADGRVLVYDIRSPASKDPFCLANYIHAMHGVMYNPVEPRLLVTANSKEGIGLWDIRKPRSCLLHYGSGQQSCMSVRFNRSGDQILALRRRMPPVVFHTHSGAALYQFDHPGYYNSCTMKSCCFAGDNDQYVMSGSDDFNLYMWKIPDEPSDTSWIGEAHMVLHDHRSIVNQVRFNPANQLVLSSGVEKVIKAWSLFPVPYSRGDLGDIDRRDRGVRPVYTHEEYINLVLHNGLVMNHDYSHQSTDEDPRMMAFFDSLVQRELEGWSSTDDGSDSEAANEAVDSNIDSNDSSSSDGVGSLVRDGDNETERPNSPFTVAFASVMARHELANEESLEAERDNSRDNGAMLEVDLVLADEVFNRREEPPLTSQPADQSQEDPQSNRSESVQGHGILPGQEPGANRRSISFMISQKRKEYLSSLQQINRGEKRGKKRRKRVEVSDSSSDETSSCNGSGTESDSSLTDTDHSQMPLDAIRNTLSESLAGKVKELQKLKRLRSLAEQADNDSDSLCLVESDGALPNRTKVTETLVGRNASACVDGCSCESGPHLFSEDRSMPGPSRCHKTQTIVERTVCCTQNDKCVPNNETLSTEENQSTNVSKGTTDLIDHEGSGTKKSSAFSWTAIKRIPKRGKRQYRVETNHSNYSSSEDDS